MGNCSFVFAWCTILLGLTGVLGNHVEEKQQNVHEPNRIREKRLTYQERFDKLISRRSRVSRAPKPFDEFGSLIVEGEDNFNDYKPSFDRRANGNTVERANGITVEHRKILELRLKAIVAQRLARDRKKASVSKSRFSPATSFSQDSEPQVKTSGERFGKIRSTSRGFSKLRPASAISRNSGLQVTRDPSPFIDTWEETATPINPEALQTRTTPEPEIIAPPRAVRPVIFATPAPPRPTSRLPNRWRITTPSSVFTDNPFFNRPEPVVQQQRLSPNEKLDLCCRKQGVTSTCQELCNFDRFTQGSVTSAFLNNKCPGPQMGQAFDCASSRADHTQCCTEMNIHLHNGGACMAFCTTQNGLPSNPLQYLSCLPIFDTIKNCYRIHQRDNANLFGD